MHVAWRDLSVASRASRAHLQTARRSEVKSPSRSSTASRPNWSPTRVWRSRTSSSSRSSSSAAGSIPPDCTRASAASHRSTTNASTPAEKRLPSQKPQC